MKRLLLVGITIAMGTGSLPAIASAQAPAAATQAPAATQPPTPTLEPGPPDHPATPPPAKPEPQQFLATAKQLLDAVPTNSLGKDGQKLVQLRDDFKSLVANYQARSSTAAPTATDAAKDASDWKTKFDDVERSLTSILGAGASLNTTSTTAVGTGGIVTTQPVGSSGTGDITATAGSTGTVLGGVAVEEIGVKNLDPGIRAQLEQVRRNIELFYDAGTQTLTNP